MFSGQALAHFAARARNESGFITMVWRSTVTPVKKKRVISHGDGNNCGKGM